MSRVIGAKYEKQALKLLKKQKIKILACNYTVKVGEVDIIADDQGVIVFIEVKYRGSAAYGTGMEMVDFNKQQRLIRTAQVYLSKHKLFNSPCRFDVISISSPNGEVEWIRNAF